LVNTSQSSSSQPTEDDERSSISTASPTVLFSEKVKIPLLETILGEE